MASSGTYGWLVGGAAAGVLVPTLGIGSRTAELLTAAVPLPWGRIGVGFLVFAAAAGLHFRHHWAKALGDVDGERQRQQAAARLLRQAGSDGMRWLRVIQENLELVVEGDQRRQENELYVQGARAHADKLEQAFQRIEGVRRQLES